MSRMSVVLPLALLLAAGSAGAEEPGASFTLGLGLGVESFGDETFQKISLTPDLAFGKFGIGVDVTLRYRFENGDLVVRQEDWVPDPLTFQETLSLYLSKFRYVRYGQKGEPLYAKFGSIEDATLGNGFIMANYANTLFLPERRVFGLALDVDGQLVGFPYVGLETFVGDVAALDVLAARAFVRPLAGTEIPIARDLQLGATIAADRDPYRYADDATEAAAEAAGIDTDDALMYVAGIDFRQPLVASPALSLAVFGDAVSQKMAAYGAMAGAGGRLAKIITYAAQLRFVGEDFVPVYFDGIYDITRTGRYALTEGAASSPAYIGWFASLGLSLLQDSIVLKASLEGPFGELDDNEDNYLNYPHLTGLLRVSEGVLPGFFFDVSYDKLLIRELGDLARAEGAVVRARLNYRSGPAVISFLYQLTYNTNDWSDPEVSSGLETLVQLK